MNFSFPPLDENKIRLASFDIGKKNFAQYVEDFEIEEIEKLEKEYNSLPKKQKRRCNGDMNIHVENILKRIYTSSSRVQTGVYDLRHDKTSNSLTIETRVNLINHLSSFSELWEDCSFIIIEQQYFRTNGIKGRKNPGTEANVDAIKIAEGTLMWFLNKYPNKKILYFGSTNKTQILGAPLGLDKPQRKKWATQLTKEIYKIRNDESMIELFKLNDRIFKKRLNSEKLVLSYLKTYPKKCTQDCIFLSEKIVRERQKLDDISDACLQAQAFKYRFFVAGF